MTDLLASLEGSALAVWTRESPSIWAYSTILTLHTFGLASVAGANAVIDFRLLGLAPRIPVFTLRPLFPIMWWAFALNFVTGILLFMADATTKAAQPMFYIKLAMIALALMTTIAVAKSLRGEAETIAATIPSKLRLLAMLSLVLWTAAIVAGRLLAYQ
ncbi:MAG: hypothetical protein ABIS29_07950 [Vicinamibacterales bacterium]